MLSQLKGFIVCVLHAPNKAYKAEKRKRKMKPKSSAPFNEELLKPDSDFTDERKDTYIPLDK